MIFLRSVRFGMLALVLRHECGEIMEEVVRIVRPWSGLRMVLHAEDRLAAMAQAFHRLVIEVQVSDFDSGVFERIRIHAEAVIL